MTFGIIEIGKIELMLLFKQNILLLFLAFSAQTILAGTNVNVRKLTRHSGLASNAVAFLFGYTFCIISYGENFSQASSSIFAKSNVILQNKVSLGKNLTLTAIAEEETQENNSATLTKHDTSIILLTNLIPMQ